MSIQIYRRLATSALFAGSLCLLASTAATAAVPRAPRPVPPAPSFVGPSVFAAIVDSAGSAWSHVLRFFASDNGGSGNQNGGHSGEGPHTEEGPGLCPHGH
jgi:hypothetical protein